jgi:hypothetical protein
MKQRVTLAVAVLAGIALTSPRALAFCRTTTCDPNKASENCEFDANRCLTTGQPLQWRSSCVTVGVHELGSPSLGFTIDDVAPIVEQAFAVWMEADCGGGEGPSLEVNMLGALECGLSEYNSKAANANIVLFREDEWPFIGAENAIGLTTTRFDKLKGDLWDADIELNAVTEVLSIGDPVEGYDLLSVLTHEAGHFLGLSHSIDEAATMKLTYDPARDGTSFRDLADDDVDGICAVYPPERRAATSSCENRHGFSEQCGADQPPSESESEGCSVSSTARRSEGFGAASALNMLTLLAGACLARLARRLRVV